MKFKDWNCKAVFGKYSNGRTAIRLVDEDTAEWIATATVNIPEENLPEGCVFIKNWSENRGMTEALMKAGIIEEVVGYVPTGFTTAAVAKLSE